MKKKQALMKNEMDKRMAELVKFSQNFKVRFVNKQSIVHTFYVLPTYNGAFS